MQKPNLTLQEKRAFEEIFNMNSGYVLDFTDATFKEFFDDTAGIDITNESYCTYGISKAKRLRAFWTQAPAHIVGKVLNELLNFAMEKVPPSQIIPKNDYKINICKHAISRLQSQEEGLKDTDFLSKKYNELTLSELNISPKLKTILNRRINEINLCYKSGSYLAAIILMGSVLEGILLNLANKQPEVFNKSASSPKDKNGKVYKLSDWRLGSLIDIAYELGYLGIDVKKFSHVLRDFRNYIHPHEEMESNFTPNQHTSDICIQVLKAAISSLNSVHLSN